MLPLVANINVRSHGFSPAALLRRLELLRPMGIGYTRRCVVCSCDRSDSFVSGPTIPEGTSDAVASQIAQQFLDQVANL